MAKITVKGYIGKDAELRTANVGDVQTSVCDFWVGENVKKRSGETKTIWHKVTIWRKYAETMAPYLKSGRKVQVEGFAEPKQYTTRENVITPYISIQADDIDLLDAPKTESEEAPWAAVEAE